MLNFIINFFDEKPLNRKKYVILQLLVFRRTALTKLLYRVNYITKRYYLIKGYLDVPCNFDVSACRYLVECYREQLR
jgi:hypothetical protein